MKGKTVDLKTLSVGGIYEVRRDMEGKLYLFRRQDLEKLNISQLPRFEERTISK